jgi:biopolymer transport protein ExbB/TolQ
MTAAADAAEHSNFIVHAFQAGGPAMFIIAAVGIATIFLILERFVTLRMLTVDKADFNEHLFGMVLRGDIRQAITYCDSKPSPLTNTLKSGLVQVMNHRPDEEVQVAMDAAVLRDTPRVEGWSTFLAVFGNLATLIGLIGTILGMIKSFKGVSKAGAAEKAAMLSDGISEALHCTAFGLIVAVIAILAYGYFQIRISRILNDVVESSMSLMNLVVANRDKMKE